VVFNCWNIPAGYHDGLGTVSVSPNTGTYTYPVGSTGSTVDMGDTNTYRYVNAENVYNKGKVDGTTVHTGTYTIDEETEMGTTVDMGASHTYRYISVPNGGTAPSFATMCTTTNVYVRVAVCTEGVCQIAYYSQSSLTCDYCTVMTSTTINLARATLHKDCYITGMLADVMKNNELHRAGETITNNQYGSTLLFIYPA
jgi:hypothetical protein